MVELFRLGAIGGLGSDRSAQSSRLRLGLGSGNSFGGSVGHLVRLSLAMIKRPVEGGSQAYGSRMAGSEDTDAGLEVKGMDGSSTSGQRITSWLGDSNRFLLLS